MGLQAARNNDGLQSMRSSIVWFRKGLRLHDNLALLEACRDVDHLYPLFILDPFFRDSRTYRVGVNRFNFLLESLQDIDDSLKQRGSRLLVLRGTPEEILPKLFQAWSITKLCFEVDTEPYARLRDAHVERLAAASGVQVQKFVGHTLYDSEWLVKQNGGVAPASMQSFVRLVDRIGDPAPPAPDPPAALPPVGSAVPLADPQQTSVPTLEEVGFAEAPNAVFQGGETVALARMREYLADRKWVAGFEKPNTDPTHFLKPSTTVLSPYLKFGCLSARLFHQSLLTIYREVKSHSKPPVSLRGQLLWREFFYTVGTHTPNFDKMAGNPLCKQIPWDENEEFFQAWKNAKTGYPWIDAIMTQLRQWGWMHHLARHAVACFLTRGDLYVSWERGKEVFEELLIDQDHFLNAANWMWLSASAFFSQYYRVYSPVTFGKKYDPTGKFIRHFLPQLKDFPAKYIYEPWTAPLEVQKRCGCIIGEDYPFPIVDHAQISKNNMSRMKQAYEANKSGGLTTVPQPQPTSNTRHGGHLVGLQPAATSKPFAKSAHQQLAHCNANHHKTAEDYHTNATPAHEASTPRDDAQTAPGHNVHAPGCQPSSAAYPGSTSKHNGDEAVHNGNTSLHDADTAVPKHAARAGNPAHSRYACNVGNQGAITYPRQSVRPGLRGQEEMKRGYLQVQQEVDLEREGSSEAPGGDLGELEDGVVPVIDVVPSVLQACKAGGTGAQGSAGSSKRQRTLHELGLKRL